MSQVDTFDYKPELLRSHGKGLKTTERPDVFFGQVGLLRKPDWAFRQRGASGLWMSDLFPHLAGVADELTVIRSMYAETSNHTPATFQQNSGFRLNGFPVLGAWLSHGLGSESDNLPAYVVIPDAREYPAGGAINWSNGFLPARHQGVVFRGKGDPLDDLTPALPVAAGAERATRDLLDAMNRRHLEERGPSDPLAARIHSYQLAAKMQLAVPEVAALNRETAATHALYGLDRPETADFGRGCLLARRLLERGVRFVQLFSGGTFGSPRRNWDGHEDMAPNHGQEARRIDRPGSGAAAQTCDSGHARRYVGAVHHRVWPHALLPIGGERRRQGPRSQSVRLFGLVGRCRTQARYRPRRTPMRSAGRPSKSRTHWHDFHATVLHLFGIDHERLTYYHNGIQRRLTNVHGHAIKDILA